METIQGKVYLPDGLYDGDWCGYIIVIQHDNKKYELPTQRGVRGIGIKVKVKVVDWVASYELLKAYNEKDQKDELIGGGNERQKSKRII